MKIDLTVKADEKLLQTIDRFIDAFKPTSVKELLNDIRNVEKTSKKIDKTINSVNDASATSSVPVIPEKEVEKAGTGAQANAGETPFPDNLDEVKKETPLTFEQVRAVAAETSKKGEKQKEAVKALYPSFGIKNVTNLKPEQYQEFVAALKAIN